jgi:hypothetical protein
MCFNRQFLPFQSAFLPFILCRTIIASWALDTTNNS